MELKEFISKTISDIIEGLDCASKKLNDSNKEVGLYSMGKSNQRHVEFDVAVVASNKTGGKVSGGGEIKVWGIFQTGAKIQKTLEESSSTVSRIKFGYPPDMQKLATDLILKQAELFADDSLKN